MTAHADAVFGIINFVHLNVTKYLNVNVVTSMYLFIDDALC